MKKNFAIKGFSVIELSIVLILVIFVLSLAVINIDSFRRKTLLENAVEQTKSMLMEAKRRSISAINGKSYKLSFDSDELFLKNEDDVLIKRVKLDNLVEIESPGEILFYKVDGRSNGGSILIRLKDSSLEKVIAVNNLGEVVIE